VRNIPAGTIASISPITTSTTPTPFSLARRNADPLGVAMRFLKGMLPTKILRHGSWLASDGAFKFTGIRTGCPGHQSATVISISFCWISGCSGCGRQSYSTRVSKVPESRMLAISNNSELSLARDAVAIQQTEHQAAMQQCRIKRLLTIGLQSLAYVSWISIEILESSRLEKLAYILHPLRLHRLTDTHIPVMTSTVPTPEKMPQTIRAKR